MTQFPSTPSAPVIRTDFSDTRVWEQVQEQVSWVTPDGFEADVAFVDDRQFEGMSADRLLALGPDRDEHVVLFIVDETTILSPEHPLLVVDLGSESDPDDDWPGQPAGRSFRALPHTIQEIENNLTTGNMDWEDFAEHLDDDGVRRELW